MRTILVVDDEQAMRRLLDMQLKQKGYHVLLAASGKEALHTLQSIQVDMVLLDIMMPEQDGLDVAKAIRKFSTVPILFLSALDDRDSMIQGFGVGADDYVSKPFDSEVLHLRIQAVLQRSSKHNQIERLKKGSIVLDIAARTVYVDEKKITPTLKELELLHLFMKSEGRVLSREELLETIWGSDYEGTTRTVDTHIKTMRIKLGALAGTYIQTVWGIGYKFEVPDV